MAHCNFYEKLTQLSLWETDILIQHHPKLNYNFKINFKSNLEYLEMQL